MWILALVRNYYERRSIIYSCICAGMWAPLNQKHIGYNHCMSQTCKKGLTFLKVDICTATDLHHCKRFPSLYMEGSRQQLGKLLQREGVDWTSSAQRIGRAADERKDVQTESGGLPVRQAHGSLGKSQATQFPLYCLHDCYLQSTNIIQKRK